MTAPAAAAYGALLDLLRGVTWPARLHALGGTAGTHKSRLRGHTAEFTEYRPYRQGDDPRRIDWKLLARTDRAFLRITSDRATLRTTLLVDASASMDFPAGDGSKWAQACRLAVGLAAVANAAGDPVGLVVPGSRRRVTVAPRTRRGVVAEIARTLEGARPSGEAPLAPALHPLRDTPRLAIVSDFLGDEAELLRAARERIAGGAEVYAVHVVAPDELEPGGRGGGAFLAADPERPALRRPFAPETRERYVAAFAAWRRETARAWRGAGAVWVEVSAAESAARAVRRIARAVAVEAHA